MIRFDMICPARPARLVVPMGMVSPHSAPLTFDVTGGRMQVVWAPAAGQALAVITPEADMVAVQVGFARGGPGYPDGLFAPRDSRFTRAADAMAQNARAIAARAGGGRAALLAIVAHVAALFDYGHPETRFYDGHDVLPQLCGMTQGSCVDINAYLVASLRAAGIEAGYVYGIFVPAEKRDWAEDGHCWVVTRCDGVIEEWDIAHHLKIGTRDIRPGLNPRPGVRLPMAHGMGWTVPTLGIEDAKLMGPPLWIDPDPALPEGLQLRLTGYDLLAA